MVTGRGVGPGVRAALIAAALGVAIMGCGGRKAAQTPETGRLRFVAEHAQKTYGDCTGSRDQCTRVRLRWMLFLTAPGPAAVDSLNQFVRVALLKAHDREVLLPTEDSVMTVFIDAYRRFAGSAPGGASHPWSLERRIELMGDTLGVASLSVTETSFLGGAHPNSNTKFASFDVSSGRALRLWDLLRGDARDSLDAAGERAFRRVRKLPPEADLKAAGFSFEGGRFRLNENFAVTATGLLFFFNDYEIGPHSLGATSLSLPWAEVMPLVRADGPLAGRGG